MIVEIVIGVILAVIILNNLEFFGGLIGGLIALLVMIAVGIAILGLIGVGLNAVKLNLASGAIIVLVVLFLLGLLIYFFEFIGWILKRLKKFYDFKTKLKFLTIKFFTPGFTDKQKIIKIKKINTLVNYGKKQYRLLNDRDKQVKIKKLDELFLKCKNDYDTLTNLINKEMSEYINPGYINLRFSSPTREDIKGDIVINTKKNQSIIKISISKDNLKVIEDPYNQYDFSQYIEYSSTRVKRAVKVAKKYLLGYFKLHPEELEE